MRGQLVMHQSLHHVYIFSYIRKIYLHDVNIDASQADRALNWTARITKNIPSISGTPRSEKSLKVRIHSEYVTQLEHFRGGDVRFMFMKKTLSSRSSHR